MLHTWLNKDNCSLASNLKTLSVKRVAFLEIGFWRAVQPNFTVHTVALKQGQG